MEDKSRMFKTFYNSVSARSERGSTHFSVDGGIHAENWSDEDEEDDEEAEYGGEGRRFTLLPMRSQDSDKEDF